MAKISPRAEDRLQTEPDGSVKCLVLEAQPNQGPAPNLRVLITKELGSEITNLVDDQANQFIFSSTADAGHRDYFLHITPQRIGFFPGTYRLRILQDGVEIFNRPLVVRRHPATPLVC